MLGGPFVEIRALGNLYGVHASDYAILHSYYDYWTLHNIWLL